MRAASSLQGGMFIWDTVTAGIPRVRFHHGWDSCLLFEVGIFQQVSHLASLLWCKAQKGYDESNDLITLILRVAVTKEILKTSSEITTVFGIQICFIQARWTSWTGLWNTEVSSLTLLKRLLPVKDPVKWKHLHFQASEKMESSKMGSTTHKTNSWE